MSLPEQDKPAAKATDYRLILATLEKRLLAAELTAGDRAFLARSDIWQNMNTEQKVRWASLAQMAGEVDTALTVLEAVNRSNPDQAGAWKTRLELLGILGRRREIAALLPQAKNFIEDEIFNAYSGNLDGAPDGLTAPEDAPFSSEPFERLHLRQKRIDRYLSLFSGRNGVFARQWVDRNAGKQGYVPVRRGFTRQDAEDHLGGRKTYGIYLLKEDNTVSVGAIDADLKGDFRKTPLTADIRRQVQREKIYMVSRIKELAENAAANTLVEFSGGKGFHFWFFFKPPAPADSVRGFLTGLVDAVVGDLSVFSLEVFPKQDRLTGKGLGNLIKLPLGVHRLTGKTSCFPECADRSMDAQLDFLSAISPVSPDNLAAAAHPGKKDALFIHPRWKEWAEAYPDLFALERKCPPLGQMISLCRNGGTLAQREERVMLQTIGFLPRAKRLLHYLLGTSPEYNPHLVDFKISRLRGTPLGCRRIHSLLSYQGDFCEFAMHYKYRHPLLHIEGWRDEPSEAKAEKVEKLSGALENLRTAIDQVLIFMT